MLGPIKQIFKIKAENGKKLWLFEQTRNGKRKRVLFFLLLLTYRLQLATVEVWNVWYEMGLCIYKDLEDNDLLL